MNTIGINATKQFNINVMLDENNFVINPKKYLKYSNELKHKIKQLINIILYSPLNFILNIKQIFFWSVIVHSKINLVDFLKKEVLD